MQAHQDLDLEKDSGTIRLVENEDGRGGGPGFYCDVCKKTCKDSVGYLDHINGRMHLRRLGQTTQAERGTLQSVKDRIAYIRAERALGATPAQRYDFDARLRQIAADQRRERDQRRRDRQEERLRKSLDLIKTLSYRTMQMLWLLWALAALVLHASFLYMYYYVARTSVSMNLISWTSCSSSQTTDASVFSSLAGRGTRRMLRTNTSVCVFMTSSSASFIPSVNR